MLSETAIVALGAVEGVFAEAGRGFHAEKLPAEKRAVKKAEKVAVWRNWGSKVWRELEFSWDLGPSENVWLSRDAGFSARILLRGNQCAKQ